MNDFENYRTIHKALGDFWYSYFGGSEQIGTYIDALTEMFKQSSQICQEVLNSYSRHTIDVYRKFKRIPLKIKYSDFTKWSEVLPAFDGTNKFNDRIQYSVPVFIKNRVRITSNIVSIGSITNGINDPSFTSTDFSLADGYLVLPFNPFKRDFTVETLSDGNTEVTIWLNDVEVDCKDLYNQLGYALGIQLESSQRYKDILNAVVDCLVNGGSKDNILKLIKAITGSDGKIYDFYGEKDAVKGIILSKGLLGGCFKGNLVLKNEELPVQVTTQEGFTRLDLPVLGSDAKMFNDLCFERGKEASIIVSDDCELAEFEKSLL